MGERVIISEAGIESERDRTWRELRDADRLDFLFEWNKRMADAIREIGGRVERLETQLREVQSQVAATGVPPLP
jgi:hypothetical protein